LYALLLLYIKQQVIDWHDCWRQELANRYKGSIFSIYIKIYIGLTYILINVFVLQDVCQATFSSKEFALSSEVIKWRKF